MTIIIDGTLGISGVDGSAGTPAYAGNDSDTGLWYPASNTLALSTGGTERMRIDSSGNVGIGTSSPVARLTINGAIDTTNSSASFTSSDNDASGITFKVRSGFSSSSSRSWAIWNNYSVAGTLEFVRSTSASNAPSVSSMTIDNSGNVGIGLSNPVSYANFIYQTINGTNGAGIQLRNNAGTAISEIGIDASVLTIKTVTALPMVFGTNNTERMRITSGGDVGIGTASPSGRLDVVGTSQIRHFYTGGTNGVLFGQYNTTGDASINNQANAALVFNTNNIERMRITSGGSLCVGKTASGTVSDTGAEMGSNGYGMFTRDGLVPLFVNRKTNDGILVALYQDSVIEGDISVSGTTVSYNGGHLSRYAQTTALKDNSLVKGTVLSNLDEMNEYVDSEGNPVANEQLNKVKVSDVEGDVNVAGVFVNWTYDEAHNVDEINMAMTGDMIIRIAQGVVVQKGDLLMSAGDGTAKPQGDDIVRSKTIAKVTSNHITCTYADGSYCVPCVLMAC